MKVFLIIVCILVFAFFVWQVALLIRDVIRKKNKKKSKEEKEHNDNSSNDLDRKE